MFLIFNKRHVLSPIWSHEYEKREKSSTNCSTFHPRSSSTRHQSFTTPQVRLFPHNFFFSIFTGIRGENARRKVKAKNIKFSMFRTKLFHTFPSLPPQRHSTFSNFTLRHFDDTMKKPHSFIPQHRNTFSYNKVMQ